MRRGKESAEGYYRDSFDYEALTGQLLVPFRLGAADVTVALFDHVCNRIHRRRQAVQAKSVLLVDGVFLLRPELRAAWELSVYLDVPESVTLARAAMRDSERLVDEDTVLHRYRQRYLPGQAIYRRECCPHDVADIVIDNADVANPQIVRWTVRD